MNNSARIFIATMVAFFALAGMIALPVSAQDKGKAATESKAKAPTTKTLFENDKVRVTESRFAAGAVSPSTARPGRVVHTVKGGTFTRIYPDGKKLKIETKTGETRWLEAETYEVRNTGKGEIVLHVVYPK